MTSEFPAGAVTRGSPDRTQNVTSRFRSISATHDAATTCWFESYTGSPHTVPDAFRKTSGWLTASSGPGDTKRAFRGVGLCALSARKR